MLRPVAASIAAPRTPQMATDTGTETPKVKGARHRPLAFLTWEDLRD